MVGFKKGEIYTTTQPIRNKASNWWRHTLLSVLLLAATTLGTQRSRRTDMFAQITCTTGCNHVGSCLATSEEKLQRRQLQNSLLILTPKMDLYGNLQLK